MKTKLTLIGTMAVACAAVLLAAMPTEEETRKAESVVRKMLAQERAALESGNKTRSEVAAAAMGLADEADTDAAKLLLMKGAFVLYVKDGNLEKAVETMRVLETAIADMPPQSVTNMIEMALKGASKKVDGERLYKLLDETRDAEYKFSYKLENRKAIITGIDPKPVGTVVIPNNIDGHSVTHIGWEAFRNCKELTSVTIPEGVTHIDVHAFDNCIGLKSVILPSSLKDIGYAAFGKCMELKSVTIPNGVRSIASDAFNGSGLKSVVIPESVTRIGDRAFCGCRELGSVTIPAGVAKLGKGVFGGCNALKLINIDSGNQAYTLVDGALYTKDRSVLVMWPNPPMSVAIPVGVTSIMDWAFTGGSGMTSVTIPASVTSIGGIAFIGCDGLKSITIPSSVKSIGEHAFERCVELTEVTMLGERPEAPKNLFPGCRKLKAIHVPANAKSWAGMKDWFGIPLVFDADDDGRQTQAEGVRGRLLNLRKRLGNVRAERAVEQLQATVDGYTWSYRVDNGEATLISEKDGKYSCAVSPTPKGDIVIPATLGGVKVTRIGRDAFANCHELTSVNIPQGVTSIDQGILWNCSGLKSVVLPSSLKTIGMAAFSGCSGLTSVTIPEGVTHIGYDAFSRCSSLTSVVIPSGVDVDARAFSWCHGLKSVTIAKGVTRISQSLFVDCTGLKSVTIPEGVTEIGVGAFMGCRELGSVTIPASVTNIEWLAFSGCEALTQINVAEGNQWFSLVDGVLYTKDLTELVMCPNGLSSATIPPSVKSIRGDAFRGCANLTAVTVPASVESCSCAFTYCGALKQINVDVQNQKYASVDGVVYTKDLEELVMAPGGLKSVPIPAGVKRITSGAFKGCSTLTSVTIPAGVDCILPWTFEGCSSLESVTILGNVTYIGHQAFWACRELTSFTMRGERPEAPNDIFMGCGKLKAIHVPANAKSWAGMKDWFGIPLVFDAKAAESRQEQSRYMIVDLDKSGIDAVSYLDDVPNGGWSDEYKTKKIAFRRIDPGSFEYMPGRSFKITKPFYIGVFEVTQKQYEMTMKSNPSEFKGDMRPVEKVGYIDLRGPNKGLGWPKDNLVDDGSYLGKLRKRIGLEFDLPTEVQLEYACRAGTTGDFNVDGVDMVKLGKCADNGGRNDHHANVGSFLPNAWGLYDMHGNVWEWCLDRGPDGFVWLHWTADAKETDTDPKGPAVGASRLHRGGSWYDDALGCRSGRRPCIPAGERNSLIGFRLACPVDGHPMKLSTDDKLRELKAASLDKKRELPGGLLRRLARNRRDGEQQAQDEGSRMSEVKLPYEVVDGAVVLGSQSRAQHRLHSLLRRMQKEEDRKFAVVKFSSGALVVPDVIDGLPVRGIGNVTFPYCSHLTSVEIPSSVTNIDERAFYSYTGRNAFKVAEGNPAYRSVSGLLLTKDGKTLVYGVNGNVAIPDGVKSIGSNAFRCCRGLMDVTIPDSVTSIGDYAFFGCNGLKDVSIGNGVTSIRSCAFSFCSGLTNVTIGDSVTSIEGCAFSQCSGLASVTIPESVTNIDRIAFLDCSGLNSFSVAEGNPSYRSISGLVMTKDGKTLVHGVNGNVTIPDSVTNIGDDAFFACKMLVSVSIPASVKVIGDGAFKMCGGLKEVIIPEGVTSIGENAFRGLGKLTTVTIPASVTNVGGGVFSYCEGLREIKVDAGNQKYVSVNGALYTRDRTELVMWPIGLKTVAIPKSVTNIGVGAFAGFKGLLSATIPDSVTSISQKAFLACSELISITICGERPNAPNNIFEDCRKLKEIHVPANAKSWAGMKEWHGIPLVFDAGVGETFSLNAAPGSVTELDLGNVPPLQFVYCPAGKFSMGYKEQPALSKVKDVEITSPFWVSKTVIRADQMEFMGLNSNTNAETGDAVINDGSIVLEKLPSALKERFGKMLPPGYVFRLPTEAEFEYLQKSEMNDKNAQTNIWGVERLYSGGLVALLDKAPAYGRVDVVRRRNHRGVIMTDLVKVNYENQPDKDPVGWTDDPTWSVFRRGLARNCGGGKLVTAPGGGKYHYSFYFVVAPDIDKLNKFYWK